MRSRVVLRNTLAALAWQVIVAVFGFVTPALVIRTYGSEVYGLVSSIGQVMRYFGLMEAGLGGAALFALYRPLADNDFDAVNKVMAFTSRYFLRIGLLFLAVLATVAPAYARGIGSATLGPEFIMVMFLVIGSSGALEFLIISRCRIILVADEKGYMFSLVGGVGVLVQQGTAIALILARAPVELVYLAAVPVVVIRGIALNHLVRRAFDGRVHFGGRVTRDESGISLQRNVFLHEIAHTINQASPLVAVGVLHGLADASTYAVFNLPISMVSLLMATLHQAVAPSFGRVVAEGGAARSNAPFLSFQFWYFAVSTWLLCATVILVTPFVRVYTAGVDDVDYMRPEFGYMLTTLAAVTSLRVVYSILINAFGLFRETARWAIATSAVGLVVTYTLGSLGAHLTIVGPVVALFLNCCLQWAVMRRCKPDVASSRGMLTFVVMLLLLAASALAGHVLDLRPDGWLSFLGYAFVVSGVVAVAVFVALVGFERRRCLGHWAYLTSVAGRGRM